MRIAVLVYDGMTALDAIGPCEVLGRIPGAELVFVGTEPGPVRTDLRMGLAADRGIGELTDPEIVLVPGGDESGPAADERVRAWLRAVHAGTRWTTSVCTGALILAEAGILGGVEATTHWAAMDRLGSLGARPVRRRVAESGKILTAAGVSAGIDMALVLASRIAGDDVARAIQLGIEYDPQPPFDAGSPDKAPAELVTMLRGMLSRDRSEGGIHAGA